MSDQQILPPLSDPGERDFVHQRYGRLTEAAEWGDIGVKRALDHFEWLLEADRWKLCGFDDINAFARSVSLKRYIDTAHQRKRIVKKLSDIEASQRAIAEAVGVDKRTIGRDLACADGANAPPKTEETQGVTDGEDSGEPETAGKQGDVDEESGANAPPEGEPEPPAPEQRPPVASAGGADETPGPAPEPRPRYSVIVLDPPWPMKKIRRDVRPAQVEMPYPTMTEEELRALELPAADNCHVWCWTTPKFLPMALRLLPVWGVEYVCPFVWHKPGGFQPVGLPQFNCEFALYGRVGSPEFTETKAFPLCFQAGRGQHSEKPEGFYDIVRRVTEGPRLDMFNRREIDGFEGWGHESEC